MVKNNKKGFTIIEVVLVLAIAGLIFLMVFIALPALQRSQRNTQRKNDLSRFVTAATSYQSNNGNKLPWSSCDKDTNKLTADGTKIPVQTSCTASNFVSRYITAGGDASQFQDPDGETYNFRWYHGTSGAFTGTNWNNQGWHVIYVVTKAKCGESEGSFVNSNGKNDFAMIMPLEGGSLACNDNQ